MFGPYIASKEGEIKYIGNNIYNPIDDVRKVVFDAEIGRNRVKEIVSNEKYCHLQVIDSEIFLATVEFFTRINAQWCNLPLTTLMISSPGEVYRGAKLNYTTDTSPVEINWFGFDRKVFLSESSQFYLELRLLQENVDKVFSIYNSFRKENADFSHLTEFQHIEFEGKVSYEENLQLAIDLLGFVTNRLVKNKSDALRYFLSKEEVEALPNIFQSKNIHRISFKNALHILYEDTKDEKYKDFTLKHFGSWEEIRLTNLLRKHVIVEEFPMMQIPFYHNELKKDEDGISLSESADIILCGFREAVGSGVRIKDYNALLEKARVFNLPEDDYYPYLQMRQIQHYKKTAGFGMGWQRYVQWLLKLPFIWEACHIPRGHLLPKP